MFGMGGTEIIVILIVALICLGPDKLPGAAKSISKGIRDIKKQSRALQQQIENDEQIGGAIRDLKSALRGEEAPRPRPLKARIEPPIEPVAASGELGELGDPGDAAIAAELAPVIAIAAIAPAAATEEADAPVVRPAITLPPLAGEADADSAPAAATLSNETDDDDLARMVKPATGTIAKGSARREPSDG